MSRHTRKKEKDNLKEMQECTRTLSFTEDNRGEQRNTYTHIHTETLRLCKCVCVSSTAFSMAGLFSAAAVGICNMSVCQFEMKLSLSPTCCALPPYPQTETSWHACICEHFLHIHADTGIPHMNQPPSSESSYSVINP